MNESQRIAYLEAMDIGVWVPKNTVDNSPRLLIGSGAGSTLLVCRDAGERSTVIATDICRFLADDPVWAWPAPEQDSQNPTVKQAIDQGLFTRIVVFGMNLADQLFDGAVPVVVGSARTVVCADLDELALSGSARKALWVKLVDTNSHRES